MHEQKPSVSVIVPIFNAEATLTSTIDSLVAQTLDSLEIICIDDGSTDKTKEILARYQRRYPNLIKCISTDNQGAYLAREEGMKIARGAYIGFCDAGDAAEPSLYETLFSRAKDSNSDIAVTGYYRVQTSGRSIPEMTSFANEVRKIDCFSGWLTTVNTSLWNKLIRKEILDKRVRLTTPPRISEDALFLLSVYPHANAIAFASEPLYQYNVSEGSAMSRLMPAEVESLISCWATTRSRIREDAQWFLPIFDLAAFVHLGVSAVLMLIQTPTSNAQHKKEALFVIRQALNRQFPLHKKNPFLSFRYVRNGSNATKMTALAHFAFSLHILQPLLRIYAKFRKAKGGGNPW